jgi:hypothetical protein
MMMPLSRRHYAIAATPFLHYYADYAIYFRLPDIFRFHFIAL